MLRLRAAPNIQANNGNTVLMQVVKMSEPGGENLRAVRLLLLSGADPSFVNINGSSVLHFAAARGAVGVVRELLVPQFGKLRADPNIKGQGGYLALEHAVINKHFACVTALLNSGYYYNLEIGISSQEEFKDVCKIYNRMIDKYQQFKNVAKSVTRIAAGNCWDSCTSKHSLTMMSSDSEG